jgi:hypothetical protein
MNYPGRIIKKDESDSSLVSAIQEQLNKRGFGPIDVDGDFGTHTESAIKEFQSLSRDSNGHPLVMDGQIGPISWAVLFAQPVGGPPPEFNQPGLFTKAIEIASSQVGVLEVPPGSNRGPDVEKYLKSAGCSPGDPWCASFVYWCFSEAAKAEGITNPLVRTGGCMTHWAETKGKKITQNEAMNNPSLIKPGFIFIIDHGNWKGHTGFVKSVANGYIGTIEGNTNTDGSREGLMVAELQRKINSISAGFIDYSG